MKMPKILEGKKNKISKTKIGALLLVLASLLKMAGDYTTTGAFNPADFETFMALLGAFMGLMGYGIRDAL